MKTKSILLFVILALATSCGLQKKNQESADGAVSTTASVEKAQTKEVAFPITLAWDSPAISFDIAVEDNILSITPSGLSAVNRKEEHDITGYSVVNAEIADLNGDGYPEAFIYLTSHGSGSYGKLIGYSVNNGKSMSLVALPEIAEDGQINEGYMGHERMAIADNVFTITFPTYKEGDSNAAPTGKTRQVQYKLVDGEALRILKVNNVTEY